MIVLHALRSYLRRARRRPASSLLVVVTLALGIGATTAVFSAMRGVLLAPLPFAQADRLVAVGESEDGVTADPTGYATYVDWSESLRSFASLCAVATRSYILGGAGDPEEIRALGVTHTTFTTFGVHPLIGRDFTADDDRRSAPRRVLLSEELWARRFGSDPSVVGRTIRMSDIDFEVIGVMPKGIRIRAEEWLDQPVAAWVALRYETTLAWGCRDCRHLSVFGRVRDGIPVSAAAKEVAAFTDGLRRRFPDKYSSRGTTAVVPFVDRVSGHRVRSTLWVVMSLASMVLLLAISNAASIRLADLLRRSGEIKVRMALGGSPLHVAALLVVESVLEALVAAALGLACASALLAYFQSRASIFLPRATDLAIDRAAVLTAVAIAFVAGALAGLFPALRARRWSLRDSGRSVVSDRRSAHVPLVALNVAIAFGLLAGSALLLRTLGNLFSVSPGFESRDVLSFRIAAAGRKYDDTAVLLAMYGRFLDAAEQRSGIERVALTTQLPFYENSDNASILAEERASAPVAEVPGGQRFGVTPHYFEALKIPLRAGRLFTRDDTSTSEPVVILNERAAQTLWPNQNAIGKRVRIAGGEGNPFRRVIGVVGNVLPGDLSVPAPLQAYLPLTQFPSTDVLGVARMSHANAAAALRDELRAADPEAAFFSAAPLRSLVDASERRRLFLLTLLAIFAGVALVLAVIGLYGIVALLASSQTREIGLRMALGSSGSRVFTLMLSKGLRIVLAGMAAGLIVSLLLARFLKSFLFEVASADAVSLIAVALVLLVTSLAACAVPALRASRLSPLDALREA